jgi:Ca2+-transporting ATPase
MTADRERGPSQEETEAMADTLAPTAVIPAADEHHPWHVLPVPEVVDTLSVDPADGLSSQEVESRRARYGPNHLTAGETESRRDAFIRQYHDPMQIVLLAAGIGSIWPVKSYGTAIVLIGLTLFNAVLGLQQEGKAAAAVEALQKMMIVKARVRRDGELRQVPAEELVPGDIVLVEAGDLVPADGRILRAATLEIAESALTGESLPVSKSVDAVSGVDTDLGDRADMMYMNTNVTRGTGEMVVTATGMSTEVGHISGMLQSQDDADTPLTRQLAVLTRQILIIAGAALVASIALNLAHGEYWKDVFIASIAFAVAAIPTGLPAVVTAILSMGTQTLAKANAIVKRLRSAETLGATSAINSDKTGTLTLNQMTAVEMTLPGRRYLISGSGYSTEGTIKRTAGQPDVPLEQFLLPMALAADAVVHDGEMIGDPTEGALVVLAEKGGLDVDASRQAFPRIAELPFDAAYKMMATFHRMQDDGGRDVVRAFIKGAPDQLLARAASVPSPDGLVDIPVDDDFKARYMEENQRLGEQGLRVLATGRKDFDASTFDPSADLLPALDGLTVLTLVGILDPPRTEAKTAIAKALDAGIEVRMITGDHAVTAQAIAGKLGIPGRAISGAEFSAMTDEQLDTEIDDIGVIARVAPEHKVRLVEVLRRKGHIVAMTGDGVNDAPALKAADIGIAMGITGTEVSKEAAAMILTDDNFSTIVRAVELGRGLYDNLTKYVRFQMGCLGGLILTFLGASLFGIVSGVPFVPLQTLWVNFTTQVFQAIGLGYGKPAPDLMERKPRPVNEPIIDRSLFVWIGIISLTLGITTLAVIWWSDDAYNTATARTMGLAAFSIANVLLSLTALDRRRSVFTLDTFDDHRFVLFTGMSLLAIVLGTELGILQRILGTVSLTPRQWLICVVAPFTILIVSEAFKWWTRQSENGQATAAPPPTVEPSASAG